MRFFRLNHREVRGNPLKFKLLIAPSRGGHWLMTAMLQHCVMCDWSLLFSALVEEAIRSSL